MNNLDTYVTARSCLVEAISYLESTQVGTDEDLDKTIERILAQLESCRWLINTQLIEPEAAAQRRHQEGK